MCDRDDKCPECGASALEACHNMTVETCAREKVECPTCGATTTEPCTYIKTKPAV